MVLKPQFGEVRSSTLMLFTIDFDGTYNEVNDSYIERVLLFIFEEGHCTPDVGISPFMRIRICYIQSCYSSCIYFLFGMITRSKSVQQC